MGVHDRDFITGQPNRFLQDRIGRGQLADVVERRGLANQPCIRVGHRQGPGQGFGQLADARGVATGEVVSCIAGQGENPERVQLGVLELAGALLDALFQLLAPLHQLERQAPGEEQVLHPLEYLGGVKRLRDEILGAHGERPALRIPLLVAGEDQDRPVLVLRDPQRQLPHHLETVDVRHVQVQQDEIRLECQEKGQRLAGVLDAAAVFISRLAKNALQEPDVGGFIVDDQNAVFHIVPHIVPPLEPLPGVRACYAGEQMGLIAYPTSMVRR